MELYRLRLARTFLAIVPQTFSMRFKSGEEADRVKTLIFLYTAATVSCISTCQPERRHVVK
jgi:hypothetical protein